MGEFKVNLAACRANAGLSQAEMAAKLGITPPTLVSWETGKTEPRLSALRMISKISGIPLEYIRLEKSE